MTARGRRWDYTTSTTRKGRSIVTDPQRFYQLHGHIIEGMEDRPDRDPLDLDLPGATMWSADHLAILSNDLAAISPYHAAQLAYVERVLRSAIARAADMV